MLNTRGYSMFFKERMDFIENMLGDSVQKHSEALPCT